MSPSETVCAMAYLKFTALVGFFWIAWRLSSASSLRWRVWFWRLSVIASIAFCIALVWQPMIAIPTWNPRLPSANQNVLATVVESPATEHNEIATQPPESTSTVNASAITSKPPIVTSEPTHSDTNPSQNDRWWTGPFPTLSRLTLVGLAWLSGSILLLLRFAAESLRQYKQFDELKLAEDSIRSQLNRFASQLGLSRVEIYFATGISTPAVCGLFKPRILLSQNWKGVDDERLSAALAHELSHVKTRDLEWSLLLVLFRSFAWICPLTWNIPKAHRSACEKLADHMAWNLLGDREAYRRSLARIALDATQQNPVHAMCMARTPQILDRLRLLQSTRTNACIRIRHRISVPLLVLVALILGTTTISERTIVFGFTAAQEELNRSQQQEDTQTPIILPKQFKAGEQSPTSIQVVAPDGSVAKDATYISGSKYMRFDLQSLFESKGEAIKDMLATELASNGVLPGKDRHLQSVSNNGMLPLEFDPKDEFVIVWNAEGYCQLSINQIVALPRVQLKAWSKFRIELRTEDGHPAIDSVVFISSRLASEGNYQGILIQTKAVSSREGFVEFAKIPWGEVCVRVDPKMVRYGNFSTEVAAPLTYIRTEPGEFKEMQFGGIGRSIAGKIQLPAGMDATLLTKLKGIVKHSESNEQVPLQIDNEGKFKTDLLPFGACSIEISSRGLPQKSIHGTKEIQIVPIVEGLSGPQIVGTIPLVEVEWTAKPNNIDQSVAVHDDFRSEQKVSLVAASNGEPACYVLVDDQGAIIRRLEEITAPLAKLGSSSPYVAVDEKRDRLYLMSDLDKMTQEQTLHVLSLSGQRLRTHSLSTFGVCRIAVDSESGNLWIMIPKENINNVDLYVIDSEGRLLKSFPISAHAICYSRSDKAIWIASRRDIQKLDPITFQPLAFYLLPNGFHSFTNITPFSTGGILAVESNHPDEPKSKNRVWRLDNKAQFVASVDIGSIRINSIAEIADEIWVTGFELYGLFAPKKRLNVAIRFDEALNYHADRPLRSEWLEAIPNGKGVWSLKDGNLSQLSLDSSHQIQSLVKENTKIRGPFWSTGK